MKTQCTGEQLEFHALGRRSVTGRFDGGRISSDAGGVLLREVDKRTGVTARVSRCFVDYRNGASIEHSVHELVSQRVYGIALGYEDLNDHGELRCDAVLSLLVGKRDVTGEKRIRERDRGYALASASTLNGADSRQGLRHVSRSRVPPPMTTQGFIPKSELFDWLRRSVRRRENVALKIVTAPLRDTITLRLSGGGLVYVNCEDRGPLDALVLLADCEQVRFTFSSALESERRELMSSDAFLKWLDTAGTELVDVRDTGAGRSPRASEGKRWLGSLRGGPARKGSARVVTVVAVIALAGLVVVSGALDDESDETMPGPTAGETSTKIEESSVELVQGPVVETTTWKAGRTYRLEGLVFVEAGARLLIEPGVTVLGGPGAALIVTRDASIHARGTADEPIVFTSAKPEGSRASGDWGGVVLLGNAPINRGQTNVEGFPQVTGGVSSAEATGARIAVSWSTYASRSPDIRAAPTTS